MTDSDERFQSLRNFAEHTTGREMTVDEVRRWIGSAVCAVCGARLGWWCPESPNHLCDYGHHDDEFHEDCIHCGEPSERK